jgi:hypothetical protein
MTTGWLLMALHGDPVCIVNCTMRIINVVDDALPALQ